MGNRLLKIAINPRPFKPACGFYLYDRVFYPVAVEVNDQRGDYVFRYAWRYGLKSGDIAYHMMTPDRRVFIDVLEAMGFKDVLESDLQHGQIVLGGAEHIKNHQSEQSSGQSGEQSSEQSSEQRSILVFVRGKIFDNRATTMYVDQGVLHPLETTLYRSMYPNPRTGELNFVKASIKFKGKNYGDVLFPRDASDVQILTRAVKKMGLVFYKDSSIKRGVFEVADTRHDIVVFQQHAE